MNTEMEFEAYSHLTDIQKFFYGQSVFLTGVTGLLGKIVLEKLLRSCPGIGTIYVVMRPKKGLTPEQRLDKLLQLELFKRVREVFPLFRKRVQVIQGDITKDELGISFEDYEKLLQNVSIVIHSAASLSFNESLKSAVSHNVKSAKNVLKLCHELTMLKVFVHVSTAYVHREKDGSVFEEIPKPQVDPEKLLDTLEWMDDKSSEVLSSYLTGNFHTTTYLITKALAEKYISQNKGDLPVAIVRPDYLCSTMREPFPGWIDSIQGISGLLLAGAKGVLRTLRTVDGFKAYMIPADYASHLIIASAWHVGITKPASIFILNATIEYEKIMSADYFMSYALSKEEEYPLAQVFRYTDVTIYHNKYAYYLHSLIDEWVPALIIDFFLFIFTGKTVLCKVYSKIHFIYSIMLRLGKDPWIHRRDNIKMLNNSVSDEDAKIFPIDVDNIDMEEYIDIYMKGGRKYLAKEEPSNISYAKKKAFIWWTVTTILKWILILYFFYRLLTSSFFTSFYKKIEERVHGVES